MDQMALERLRQFLMEHLEVEMMTNLQKLFSTDRLRNNTSCWLRRAGKPNGQIVRNEQGTFLAYIPIKKLLGIPITADE